ncbi:MAG TPA: PQQ-dependent sugar dehydrogenase [Frankiaceae bacterium]|jgi:hypothetical protein|nr:PQQ-dependent sugar dehydrogenase [Frankiaceae bacterium]
MRRYAAALALVLVPLMAPRADAGVDPRALRLSLVKWANGLSEPVALDHAPGDTARVFVVERRGTVRVIRNGVLKATPFLDLRDRVNTSGEGGALSIAFQPDYSRTGYFFVSWTDASMTLHVTKFHAHPWNDVTGNTGIDVLTVPHPTYTNHNAGQLAFGPNAYLFVSTGDGGGSGDPGGNAQDLRSLLGKILRIDVTHGSDGLNYSIPSTNPYATSTTARREIWHRGLRNPWRFSFDRGNPNLWIADVGQGAREEVNRTSGSTTGGANLGWDCREGTLTTSYGGDYCTGSGYTSPVHQYDTHTYGCAVIGGYVYRGAKHSALLGGTYVYGDYCSGRVWGLGPDASGRLVNGELGRFAGNILAFGRDASNELYLLGANGSIYRVGVYRR